MSCRVLIFMSWVRTDTYWIFLKNLWKSAVWTQAHCLRRFVREDFLSIFCFQGTSYV
jgi:hypothetical protein